MTTNTRINAIEISKTTGKTKELLDGIKTKMQTIPNVFLTMANSPATLQGYLSFSEALGHGTLSAKLREQIAITVAESNGCEYCLSAHSTIGKKLGLSDGDIHDAQLGKSNDAKTSAALKFAKLVVAQRGEIGDKDFEQIKSAGYNEGEIIEIVAVVSLNIFTNYFNHIAKTVNDFPKSQLTSERA